MFLQIKKLKTFKIHQMNVCQIMGRGGGGLYRKNKIYEHISQQQMQNTVNQKGKKKVTII